ncbi:MAG: SDR family oxidoreductase [Deinococcota bacterium]
MSTSLRLSDTSSLAGKTAVVSGATRGIGRAVSVRLAQLGATVHAVARSEDDLTKLAQENSNIHGHVLDVANPASIQTFAEAVSSDVSILVNNAGVGVFKPVEDISLDEWNRVFDVNVRGTFLLTQAFLASIKHHKGQIINVTSDVSARTFANGSLYTASKYAQRAFTQALQMEVQPHGVRVTEVRPGVVATYFGDSDPQAVDESALSPEDVADAIIYALTRPARMRMDELLFHPSGQAVEF